MQEEGRGENMPLTNIVPEYHSSCPIVRRLFWSRIKYSIQFGNIGDDKRILDVGCGAGYLFKELKKRSEKGYFIGIDCNANVDKLTLPGCEFRREDVLNLSFENDCFDIVYALDTLEHIKEVAIAIKQIKRVLKPDGKLIISGPTESLFYKFCRFLLKGTFSEKYGPGAGAHFHTIDSLNELIIKQGFIKEKNINLPRFFPFVLERIFRYNNVKQ